MAYLFQISFTEVGGIDQSGCGIVLVSDETLIGIGGPLMTIVVAARKSVV